MKKIEEINTITPEDKRLLSELKQLITRYTKNAIILLYGSIARGDRAPESDYDVLVLSRDPLSTREENAIRDAVYELELAYEVVISIMFYGLQQWDSPLVRVTPYHQNIEKEAVMI